MIVKDVQRKFLKMKEAGLHPSDVAPPGMPGFPNHLAHQTAPGGVSIEPAALSLCPTAMPTESREVRLASRPQGEPSLDNFSFATVEVRDPNPGEVLVRNVCISVDPYMRGRMNDAKSYVPPFQIGQPLEGGAVGRVIASQDEKLPVGTYVQSMYGWREAFVAPAASLQIVDTTVAPASAYLGILGVTGLTAWVGLNHIARLKVGETIFVSGGAGAVGNAACQLARIHGCKVIASAGSEEKVSFLRDELKVEYAFNYRDGEPLEHLKRAAPDGIHVYFDNTGGPQLEAALSSLRNLWPDRHVWRNLWLQYAGARPAQPDARHQQAPAS